MPLDLGKLRHDADHATSILRLRDIAEQAINAAQTYESALQEIVENGRPCKVCDIARKAHKKMTA